MSDASQEGPTVTFSFMMKWGLQSEQESLYQTWTIFLLFMMSDWWTCQETTLWSYVPQELHSAVAEQGNSHMTEQLLNTLIPDSD